jgi:hypothetical protein
MGFLKKSKCLSTLQEILCFLGNQQFHLHIYKSLILDHISIQINPVHIPGRTVN